MPYGLLITLNLFPMNIEDHQHWVATNIVYFKYNFNRNSICDIMGQGRCGRNDQKDTPS
jgi:hypothetical protein